MPSEGGGNGGAHWCAAKGCSRWRLTTDDLQTRWPSGFRTRGSDDMARLGAAAGGSRSGGDGGGDGGDGARVVGCTGAGVTFIGARRSGVARNGPDFAGIVGEVERERERWDSKIES